MYQQNPTGTVGCSWLLHQWAMTLCFLYLSHCVLTGSSNSNMFHVPVLNLYHLHLRHSLPAEFVFIWLGDDIYPLIFSLLIAHPPHFPWQPEDIVTVRAGEDVRTKKTADITACSVSRGGSSGLQSAQCHVSLAAPIYFLKPADLIPLGCIY